MQFHQRVPSPSTALYDIIWCDNHDCLLTRTKSTPLQILIDYERTFVSSVNIKHRSLAKKCKLIILKLKLQNLLCIRTVYSIISKCNNKTYSRTTAIIFQRVVKRETKKAIRTIAADNGVKYFLKEFSHFNVHRVLA